MRFNDTQTEWRISDIEGSLLGKVDNHEFYSLRSDVDRLEHSLREACALIDGLRSELEACKDQVNELQRQKEESES